MSLERKKLIIYLLLTIAAFAVYWQVNQFDFVHFDDNIYITQNPEIRSGITAEGIRWAFSTKYFYLWHPLVWLSLMADYRLFGLKAGGYHLTNLIFHLLSTLALFWFLQRTTGKIWRCAFVAGLFALHPLHVESVAWIAERKDVLSTFFWMLTLCFYAYYIEKPVLRRYLLVLFSFLLALMSKPMVITLPLIMIFLDYWPLKRFEANRGRWLLWQIKEKTPFFILSMIDIIITLYNPHKVLRTIYAPFDLSSAGYTLLTRILNAPIAFATYLEKTFWPYNLAIFYPFPAAIPVWHVIGALSLIVVISAAVLLMIKKAPYLFVGWTWYVITVAPVLGIVQIGGHSMADRYTYIPLVGIFIMLAWGIPSLIRSEKARKKYIFPAGATILGIMALLTWKQCGYWENGITIFEHAIKTTKGNYMTHNNLAMALADKGRINEAIDHYNESIKLSPDGIPYNNLGNIYADRKENQKAIECYNEAVRLRPDYADAYYNRGLVYAKLDKDLQAMDDYTKAIDLKPTAQAYNNRGNIYNRLGQYKRAIDDYNDAIGMDKNYPWFYINRASAYFNLGDNQSGCPDAQKACDLGNCSKLKDSETKGLCR